MRTFGYAEIIRKLIEITSEQTRAAAERKSVCNGYVHCFRHIAEDINSKVFRFKYWLYFRVWLALLNDSRNAFTVFALTR